MNTMRIARRRMQIHGGSVPVDRRVLLSVGLLCLGLFAGFFALGRAMSPGSAPPAEVSPSLQVAFAGAADPLRLSSAPAIQAQGPAAIELAARASARAAGATANPSARARKHREATPQVQAPVREVVSTPTPAPKPRPTPASTRRPEGGKSKSESSSGTSFDSSG